MKRKYKRLTYADRQTIEKMCKSGDKPKTIANAVGVHVATIYHEYERGGKGQQYNADTAQKAI
ncbi:MAG: helix-turn-helix domain containing protein [Clostridia bacterium]|nr:helix-turn-helix domain containing protein [Clostridia bacterium]